MNTRWAAVCDDSKMKHKGEIKYIKAHGPVLIKPGLVSFMSGARGHSAHSHGFRVPDALSFHRRRRHSPRGPLSFRDSFQTEPDPQD